MVILRILLFIFILLVLIYALNSFIWIDWIKNSEYGVTSMYGIMGSGKSTLIQKLIVKYQPKGWKIYSNFNMSFASYVDPYEIGKKFFPPNSLILIDEAGVWYSNRNWKNTDPDFVTFLRSARKLKCKIVFFSQSNDLEKRIRDLSHRIYIIKKYWLFSIARGVSSTIDITNNSGDSENSNGGDIIYKYQYVPLTVGGSIMITWLPRYSSLFDSDELIVEKPYFDYSPKTGDIEKLSNKYYRKWRNSFIKFRFKSTWINFVSGIKFNLIKLTSIFNKKSRKKSKKTSKDDVNKLFGFSDNDLKN